MATLVILAHQDDEIGVLPIIQDISARETVLVAFLTDGGDARGRRNRESEDVLTSAGVEKDHIAFIGSQLRIGDQRLPAALSTVSLALADWLSLIRKAPDSIISLAWEGGHPDHDAAHLVALRLALNYDLQKSTWFFPLYHGESTVGPFFLAMSPLRGIPSRSKRLYPLTKLGSFTSLLPCWRYRSQWKTWCGLFPMALVARLLLGGIVLTSSDMARISARPHEGRLFYERRFRYDWSRFDEETGSFRTRLVRILTGEPHGKNMIL